MRLFGKDINIDGKTVWGVVGFAASVLSLVANTQTRNGDLDDIKQKQENLEASINELKNK